MTPDVSTARHSPATLAAAILAVLGLWTYGAFLGASDLLNPDEPRYAVVARGMLESGDWLIPRLAERPYAEKPPLFFWVVAAVGAVRGEIDETAARLPSVLAATGTLLLVLALGRRLFPDPRTGLVAGVAAAALLGTSSRFLVLANRANIDMMLAFWTTAAFAAFLRGFPIRRDDPAPRPGWQAVGFALAGVGVLTKGVGAVLFVLGIVTWLAVARGTGTWRDVAWARGLLALAATVAAWAVPVALVAPPEYREAIFFRQTLTRMVDPWTHVEGWGFYLKTLPLNLLPWTTALPFAAWAVARVLRRGEDDADRRGVLFALAVAASTFVFFTLLPGKRDYYLLPALPWLCLLAGWAVARALAPAGEGAAGLRATAWTIAGLHAFAGLVLCVWPHLPPGVLPPFAGKHLPADAVAVLAWPARGIGALALAGSIAAALLLRRGRLTAAAAVLVLVLVPGWNLYRGAVRPPLAARDSARDLAARVARVAGAQDAVVAYGPYEEGLPFYARRAVESAGPAERDALLARLVGGERVVVVTTRAGEAELRAAAPGLRLAELDCGRIGRDEWVVLTRNP